jgi:hypothetical protein
MRRQMKGVATALLTPIRFAMTTGHFRSSLARKAVDQQGRATPWYTFSAIEFLKTLDFSGDAVLEYGGGQSTLWWAEHARSVFTVEDDADWFAVVASKVGHLPHVEVHHCPDLAAHAEAPRGRVFDVVVIDGGDRRVCAEVALDVIDDDGLIVLDNSEGYWGEEGDYPILRLLDGAGWLRVDFSGYAAASITPTTTSLFFRPNTRRLHGLPPPRRLTR